MARHDGQLCIYCSFLLACSNRHYYNFTYATGFHCRICKTFTEQAHAGSADAIKQIGEENFERNLMALQSTNGPERALVYFLQSLWIGFFISIIISIVLRKQPKQEL